MSELYKIIGLRDVDDSYEEEFDNLVKNESPEAMQIAKGYTNPLTITNIIKCRMRCLKGG